MRVLVTGHTGFKGSWLSLLLNELGHEVFGFSLPPLAVSNYECSRVSQVIQFDVRGDIRDLSLLASAISNINPDFICHLAAQPFVRESLRNPRDTYDINVNGTLNVLSASANSSQIKGVLVVTTDKVYSNSSSSKLSFREDDKLGFSDPYSTSKTMADLLTQSWTQTSQIPIGIARAGNVIGGGDFGLERLIPDLIRSAIDGEVINLRNPTAVRPWQYVLDCLYGYVLQMQSLVSGKRSILNFGPRENNCFTVEQVANGISNRIEGCHWKVDTEEQSVESNHLQLNSSRARNFLKWKNIYDFQETLDQTAEWYRNYLYGQDMHEISHNMVKNYLRKCETEKST